MLIGVRSRSAEAIWRDVNSGSVSARRIVDGLLNRAVGALTASAYRANITDRLRKGVAGGVREWHVRGQK